MKEGKSLFKTILWGALSFLTLAFLILILWYVDDIDKVDDSAFLPLPYNSVADEDNGFLLLEEYALEFKQAVSTNGNSLASLTNDFEANKTEILESDFIATVPERIAEVLAKKSFREKELMSFTDILPDLGFYRNSIRFLSAQAVLDWERKNYQEAFEKFNLAEELTCRIGEQTRSLIGVLVSVAMHGIIDQAKLTILDKGDYNQDSLKLLQNMKDRSYLQRQMKVSLQMEYKMLFKMINSQAKGVKSLAYCDNRTKAFYMDLMVPFFVSLDSRKFSLKEKDLDDFDNKIKNFKAEVFYSRNTLGRVFMAMCIPAVGSALKKVKVAYVRRDLLNLRMALEQYRLEHGSFPETLEEMTSFNGGLHDPWTDFKDIYRYDSAQGLLYSVGDDFKDDGGLVKADKSYSSEHKTLTTKALDFGMKLNSSPQ